MNNRPKRLKAGDIFWERFGSHYFFARVLIDMSIPCKQKAKKPDGIFDSSIYAASYYIEFYKGIYDKPEFDIDRAEVLFNGFFFRDYLHSKQYKGEGWSLYSNKQVDITTLDFPESVWSKLGSIYLAKGELSIKTSIASNSYDDILIGNIGASFAFTGMIYEAISIQNIQDLMRFYNIPSAIKLSKIDCRYNPELHNKLYKAMGEDPNISYFELALKHGYDIRRFFE